MTSPTVTERGLQVNEYTVSAGVKSRFMGNRHRVQGNRKDMRIIHQRSQNNKCSSCGCLMGGEGRLRCTLDHTMPLSKGGADTLENTTAMCTVCNEIKADSIGDKNDR